MMIRADIELCARIARTERTLAGEQLQPSEAFEKLRSAATEGPIDELEVEAILAEETAQSSTAKTERARAHLDALAWATPAEQTVPRAED